MDILVGIDGSPASTQALAWALEQARLRGAATILAVHAYRRPDARSPYAYRQPHFSANLVNRLLDEERTWRDDQETIARRRAEAVVDRAIREVIGEPGDGNVAIKRIVVPGEPARTLIEMSESADVLVVGNRGRGGFRGLRLGSVSQQCVNYAQCPVMVIR